MLDFNDDLAKFLANNLNPNDGSPSLSSTRSPTTQRRVSLKSFKSLFQRSDSRTSSLYNSPSIPHLSPVLVTNPPEFGSKSIRNGIRPLTIKSKPISQDTYDIPMQNMSGNAIDNGSRTDLDTLRYASKNRQTRRRDASKNAVSRNHTVEYKKASTSEYNRKELLSPPRSTNRASPLLNNLTEGALATATNLSVDTYSRTKVSSAAHQTSKPVVRARSPSSASTLSSASSFHLRQDRDWFLRESLTPRFNHLHAVLKGNENSARKGIPDELPPLPTMPSLASLTDFRREASSQRNKTTSDAVSTSRIPSSIGVGLPFNDSQWTLEAVDDDSEEA